MEPYRVLVVDDDEPTRKMLGRFLDQLGYEVALAANTRAAIDRLERGPCDAVVTDLHMPGPDGIQLLGWVTAHRSNVAVVIISGSDDVKLAVQSMKNGASDYVVKPFRLSDVGETIGRAIIRQRERMDRANYLIALESRLEQKTGQLRDTMSQLEEASQVTLEALTSALDVREHETQAHSKRVSDYSVHLAGDLGVSGPDLEVVRQGSMLHDIGKIGIPDRILLKPESLTEQEWVEMRKHPEIGSWIVSGVEYLKPASGIVIAHHERFDGSGYPFGRAGEEIPLGARVFAIADTLDAVLSDRPYRGGQSYEHARQEISRNAGTQFDPQVAQCFLRTDPAVWEKIRENALSRKTPSPVLN
jgi:putative nucleotidyltransferase with HDIG domain